MPEYLAPGVYIEETSYRAKSIEGVSTTTTGFVGPTRYGPIDGEPELLTSLVEFERIYGDRQMLNYSWVADDGSVEPRATQHNFVWHGVRAFFEEGGKRLYVQRVFRPLQHVDDQGNVEIVDEGYADVILPDASPPESAITIRARYPGEAGNRRIRLTLRFGPNALTGTQSSRRLNGVLERDVVWIMQRLGGSPPSSPPEPEAGHLYLATRDESSGVPVWYFDPASQSPAAPSLTLDDLMPNMDPEESDQVRVVTVSVTVFPTDEDGVTSVWEDLPLDQEHERAGAPDSIFAKFAAVPENRSLERSLPIVIKDGDDVTNGLEVLDVLLGSFDQDREDAIRRAIDPALLDPEARSIDLALTDGDDGERPTAAEYGGQEDPETGRKSGLVAFEDIEDISIIAAPGSTFDYQNGYRGQASAIMNHLIGHATRMRYRIAVLDSGNGQAIRDVRAMRATVDSTYAAFYYPWIRILDPVTQRELDVPPSGFVAGIYARNDIQRAVYKAPANEVAIGAIGLETLLNKAQQDVLNPEGINCFRFFEGRGFRLWGARTISSDPEWKYVNLRRYFIYLERSIDRGTQWAVFEPNGERLWANVRRTIEDFLLNEFMNGALLGSKPEQAFFVKCDRSTMTQNDLDNGRLVCLIGVAALRPAEFVIFRIGQWTADRR
jgi:phage tail sheath protein FI